MSSNVQAQEDELEALTAIYGDDFCLTSSQNGARSCHVTVQSETTSSKPPLSLKLVVTFPSDYPSSAPPVYEVREAPFIDDGQLQQIAEGLDSIYKEGQGEVVLYQWVEWLREFLTNEAAGLLTLTSSDDTAQPQPQSSSSSSSSSCSSPDSSPPNKVVPVPKTKALLRQCPRIVHGEPLTDRKSTFQAHAACISAVKEVEIVLSVLKSNRKIATASHNILAYRLYDAFQDVLRQDCDDDGETAAGGRLLHLLQIMDARNVMVVVTRWYGGIQLHADRFKHINNVARILLQDSGTGLQHKEGSSGSSVKKKASHKSRNGRHR